MSDHTELFALVNKIRESGYEERFLYDDIQNCHNGRLHGPITNENLHLFRVYRNRVSADPQALLDDATVGDLHPDDSFLPDDAEEGS